jgi:hypothetical protein
MLYTNVSQELGRDPLLHRQNLCYDSVIKMYGSHYYVLFYFVGRQLQKVENHCSTLCASKISLNGLTENLLIERW